MIKNGLIICLLLLSRFVGAQCDDPKGICTAPCPAALACYSNEDCGEGYFCSWAQETPASCFYSSNATWVCSQFEPIGGCTAIPEQPPLPTYTIIDLGTLGGYTGQAWSINNTGQVVGQADDKTGRRRAFIWTAGQMTNIHPPIPMTAWSSASDINDSGQVIIVDSTTSHFWSQGVFTHIQGLNPGGSAYAQALNNNGEVVGISRVSASESHSFHWHNGITTDLQTTLGIGIGDINDLGQIAGNIGGPGTWHAAFWDGTAIVDLGTLGGATSGAGAITNEGLVLGVSEGPKENTPRLDFLWHNGQMINLVEVTGRSRGQFIRYALNNCGEILLEGDDPPGPVFYIYHVGLGLSPVRGIISPFTQWEELRAFKMNDRGQIVGYGFNEGIPRPFLATPVRGDADHDGDRDLRDVARLQAAFTGTLNQNNPGCERADIDGDGDVDLLDMNMLEEQLAGPGGAHGAP